jgi:uncharacterized protein YjbJ (UPF0337 family)
MDDKMKHKADEIKGAAKERIGGATGDEHQQAEGKIERAEANLKQAADKVKDAFK